MINLGDKFTKMLGNLFIPHKGCLIDPREGAFWWAGCRFNSEQEAKDFIDINLSRLGNRLKQNNNVNVQEKSNPEGR